MLVLLVLDVWPGRVDVLEVLVLDVLLLVVVGWQTRESSLSAPQPSAESAQQRSYGRSALAGSVHRARSRLHTALRHAVLQISVAQGSSSQRSLQRW